MGYAHGELLTEKAHNMLNSVWEYLEQQIVSFHPLYTQTVNCIGSFQTNCMLLKF